MAFATHPGETDLLLPDPNGGDWPPMTVFTHCSLLSVPDAAISVFVYLRCQPHFGLSQGGVSIFRGLDNPDVLGVEHLNYCLTMPWPTVEDGRIATANGLTLDFVEPGATLRITYDSADGATSLDVTQTALTPLLARGHIIPGEEARTDPAKNPGGSEQFMHSEGFVALEGERYVVDSYDCRDRSWGQVRSEDRNSASVPPVCWTPMYFGDDLIVNQVSFEPEDSDPMWAGLFLIPADAPTHHFAWIRRNDEQLGVRRVRREVQRYHPTLFAPLEQSIDIEVDDGSHYRFEGDAIAMAPVPAWTNAALRQFLYRWTNAGDGRVAHCSGQEIWMNQAYQRRAQEEIGRRLGASAS